tara:strand:+ start:2724 stop:3539 length:816 start_codon:yes stop_codon:yes gene_type:complete
MSDPEKVRQMREEIKEMANQATNKVLNDNPNIEESREVIYEKAVKKLLVRIITGEIHLENYSQDYLKKSAKAMAEEKGIRLTEDELKKIMEGGRRRKRKTSVPKRYVPKQLSKKDKKKQAKELMKSRKAYKKGKYHTRKKMKSFKNKVSPHIIKARKMYKVDKITPNKKLAKACGCKIQGLRKIVKKGQGAYFSSGSRPNQTGHSWGYARMASAITGGKASAVDYNILEKYCTKKSKALKLAKKMRGKGTRRVKQVKIGGRRKSRKKRISL